jgi:hypothetical protein
MYCGGEIAIRQLHWLLPMWPDTPSTKPLTRISLVIGIYKALNIYFGKPWAERHA